MLPDTGHARRPAARLARPLADVDALAAASPADVIREWQGLGYNRRGLNLHRAACVVAERGWPDDLTELPGVGPYTASAVRAFAFGDPCSRATRTSCASRSARATASTTRAAGADGSRTHRVPRAHPALRRASAGRALPVARATLRAAAQAVAVRGLVPPAARRTLRLVAAEPRAVESLDADAVASLERDGLVATSDGVVRLPA